LLSHKPNQILPFRNKYQALKYQTLRVLEFVWISLKENWEGESSQKKQLGINGCRLWFGVRHVDR
jgi:hypothetical protein